MQRTRYNLLTEASPKMILGLAHGWRNAILYLAPCNESGVNTCQRASRGCRAACLYTAGRGGFEKTQSARVRKTRQYHENPAAFLHLVAADIHALCASCELDRSAHRPCVRLNGTSDLEWPAEIFEQFPSVQFYDYTKVEKRMDTWLAGGEYPANYHLTWSRAERRDRYALTVLERGGNVAAVFEDRPDEWRGYPTVNGDQHDLTFLYPAGSVIALSQKGRAQHDATGFVIRQ